MYLLIIFNMLLLRLGINFEYVEIHVKMKMIVTN